MARNGENRDVVVEVRSQPRLLRSIRGLVRGYVDAFGLPKDRVDDVVLAVDEACCNSIRHAYHGEVDRRLVLSLTSTGDRLEVELRDDGVPALPERVRPRDFETPSLDDLKPGGLGIPLIYKVFDEVQFIPGKLRGNRLVMRLRTDQAQDSTGDGQA